MADHLPIPNTGPQHSELNPILKRDLTEPEALSPTETILRDFVEGPSIDDAKFGIDIADKAAHLRQLAIGGMRAECATSAREFVRPEDLKLDALAPDLGILLMQIAETNQSNDPPLIPLMRLLEQGKKGELQIDPLKQAFLEGVLEGIKEEMIHQSERDLEVNSQRLESMYSYIVYDCKEWLSEFPGLDPSIKKDVEALHWGVGLLDYLGAFKAMLSLAEQAGLEQGLIRVANDFMYSHHSIAKVQVNGETYLILLRSTPLPESGLQYHLIYPDESEKRSRWPEKIIVPDGLKFTAGRDGGPMWRYFDTNLNELSHDEVATVDILRPRRKKDERYKIYMAELERERPIMRLDV